MRMGFRQHGARGRAVGFRSFGSTIWWKVLDNPWEGRDWHRRNRERAGLRGILVIEEDGGDIEVISNLVCNEKYKKARETSISINAHRYRQLSRRSSHRYQLATMHLSMQHCHEMNHVVQKMQNQQKQGGGDYWRLLSC